jgi:phosphoribosylformylglycinamidine (FGAM) synthase-like enzyme/phosphoribosylformylglycinamidine (FGAM) synthase PurS component
MSQSVVSAARVSGSGPGVGASTRVHRFEVWPLASVGDPRGEATKAEAGRLGIVAKGVRTARVYLIQADLTAGQVERVGRALLTNPVVDDTRVGVTACGAGVQTVEVMPLPGVMDPAAQTVEDAVRELTGVQEVHAVTGVRYDFEGVTRAQADEIAARLLFNPAIQGVHTSAYVPGAFPVPRAADQTLRRVALRELSDEQLTKLSRDAHLFLSLEEMQALRAEYQRVGREPTDIELETLAQTWSEHCVHKTLKSRIVYRETATGAGTGAGAGVALAGASGSSGHGIKWEGRPGHVVNADGSVTIDNLLKRTVAAATHELIAEGVDWTLSVFKDNSGVIRFDETHAVCIKVETHNHPSAIEPYGGAATGVGGCIRDVIATGLGAQPIANTDVFCVGYPDDWQESRGNAAFDAGSLSRREGTPYALPKGVLHPRRVLSRVVDGVRDYGNRMGIPTVNGAVYFDNRYVGNPLVFCGCIGLMRADMVHGGAKPGDRIIALGGRTGRDGIHGATFSSAELTDTHADEFSHAVQIGNAIEEKRTLDAIMRARDSEGGPLYHGMTDCGAGGFSSAVGEMGSKLGAEVHLDRAPLKYAGLRYDEIWISESQERFVLAVPAANVPALQKICDEEGVLLADLGHFGTPNADLILNFRGEEVGRLSMHFLHEGIPMPTREAVWNPVLVAPASSRCWSAASAPESRPTASIANSLASTTPASTPAGSRCHQEGTDLRTRLLQLLAHPNIASKRWIVRQYDHEVRGNTVVKPLVGPGGIGPGDATVIQPVPGSKQGLAIGCGMAVHLGDVQNGGDPYEAALAAVDECVRNLVCVGADPDRIAILDNFCWPSCGKPENLASLVRAAEGCYDAAKAYRTPFVSGKDSLNNQLRLADGRVIEIPPTLLITGMGVLGDVSRCVTMDLKARTHGPALSLQDRDLFLLRSGSIGHPLTGHFDALRMNRLAAQFLSLLIQRGFVAAVHDVSEGGLLTAVAEMLIASSDSIGAEIDVLECMHAKPWTPDQLFHECCGSYVIQLRPPVDAGGSLQPVEPGESVESLANAILVEAARKVGYSPSDLAQERVPFPWFYSIGHTNQTGSLLVCGWDHTLSTPECESVRVDVSDLRQAFLGTLDW